MIEWIVILLIIFCSIVWHYSHSIPKYTVSQIKESQISLQLNQVWEEKTPIVISDVTSRQIWVADSLKHTQFWGAQPIWYEYQTHPQTTTVVQKKAQNLTWAEILGLQQLESDILLEWFQLSPFVFNTRTEAHIGFEALRQTYGWATSYRCTDGEVRCILLHSLQKSRMPTGWKGLRWINATMAHHPLWTQVQYIEIILRPSTVLIVPPHWIVAIEPVDSTKPIWWTRTDIHHPISQWAQMWNERDT